MGVVGSPGAPFRACAARDRPKRPHRDLFKFSEAPPWLRLGAPQRLWGRPETLPNPKKSQNKNVKISPGFPSKIEPWQSLADPGTPKRGSYGPEQVHRRPSGRPLGRRPAVLGPSLTLSETSLGPSRTETMIFCQIAEMPIYVRSRAHGAGPPMSRDPLWGPKWAPGISPGA